MQELISNICKEEDHQRHCLPAILCWPWELWPVMFCHLQVVQFNLKTALGSNVIVFAMHNYAWTAACMQGKLSCNQQEHT